MSNREHMLRHCVPNTELIDSRRREEKLDAAVKALDTIAFALSNIHDWQYEDRMNRTIDDLPPAIIVEAKTTDTKGPTE